MSVIELPSGMALKVRYGHNPQVYRGIIVRLMAEIGEALYDFFKRLWKNQREDSKKGWHEEHYKVPKKDIYYRERFMRHVMIPRLRITFSILVRN